MKSTQKPNKPWPIAEIDQATYAFPASVKHLMPPQSEIPEEFKSMNGRTKWNRAVSQWFFEGLAEIKLTPKEGIDPNKAVRHLYTILRSFEPKHEHKESAVAYLMSQWFEDVECI